MALELARAVAEQDPQMIATMRRDWDETGTMPVTEAHRRHHEIAVAAGFAGSDSADAAATTWSAVVSRAHRQHGSDTVD